MSTKRWTQAISILAVACILCGAGCSDHSSPGSSGAGSELPMMIEPNAGVGKIRAGMSIAQVVAELGEPQRRTAHALEYTRLGLAVLPGADGVAQVVMCGDVTGINGPFVKAFTGRTKEGVGMNSTRDEVIKALGDPTESEAMRGGQESMKYQPLGITLTLEGGRVHHMIVRLQPGQPAAPSIQVDLAPTPAAH